MRKNQPHLALFGNRAIPRIWCKDCRCMAFVIDSELQCCGSSQDVEIKTWKRESLASGVRSRPGAKIRNAILENQGNCCLYCGRKFGEVITLFHKETIVRCLWDHIVPFSYLQGNPGGNWAACCQMCNGWKGSTVFDSLDEAMGFLRDKWQEAVEF